MGEIGVAAAGSLISDRQGEGVLVGGVTNHDKEQEKSSLPHSCAAVLCGLAGICICAILQDFLGCRMGDRDSPAHRGLDVRSRLLENCQQSSHCPRPERSR